MGNDVITLPPYFVRVGDAWTIVLGLVDPDGNPRDLSGETVSASLFQNGGGTRSLTGASGGVTVLDAAEGRIAVRVAPGATSAITAQPISTTIFTVGISVQIVDTAGDPFTYPPQPIVPLSFRDFAAAPESQPGTLVGLPQASAGPAGPANKLTIGSVVTLQPGAPASASITGTSPNQALSLAIPQGLPGGNFTLSQVQALILDSFAATQGMSLDLSSSSNIVLF